MLKSKCPDSRLLLKRLSKPFRSAGNYTHATKVHTGHTLTANYYKVLCRFNQTPIPVVTAAAEVAWLDPDIVNIMAETQRFRLQQILA